ncbi:MAG: MoxR family ATPase [marine benthic group bacterium]|jgi:MoxR-like ATPase|nr:MoxR family ATPase [Gemmatimonadota bacterium]MCL7962850.1 MoxR family ATPase [Candidatus Carthagonibacter metallireducens]MCL7938201.1 MoxR family ATPase [Gemmatimonadota bacterium]MCL7956865.1 MoxR family ATPase [Gemmatimonadota bacterium]MCL7964659.1 MoxR family ATPase [Gemmatimonadota bacterium]
MTGAAGGAGAAVSEAELERRGDELRDASEVFGRIQTAVGSRVVGQNEMMERLLVGLLTGGHVLLEGVPGLAKTLAVRTLADAIHTTFRRIQFTPDLLPADLIGTLIWDESQREFVPKKGPIFANLVLADEVNRAPAKVQSALLEAMQERQVTIGEASWPVPVPFLVLATQNPIEHEGTYPLPEAQVDRFMLKIRVDYPDREEEREILRRVTTDDLAPIAAVATPDEILAARSMLPQIRLDERVENYILDLVRATREAGSIDPELGRWVEYGASPRASIFLGRTARAHAFLDGRPFTVPEDVQAFALDVLRHRIMLTFEAEAELVTSEQIVERILAAVPVP